MLRLSTITVLPVVYFSAFETRLLAIDFTFNSSPITSSKPAQLMLLTKLPAD